MKNFPSVRSLLAVLLLFLSSSILFSNPPKSGEKKTIINKKENPNYDPNKGLLGKPKDQKIIKRTRNEPILKNRKYEPKRFQKK